MSKRWGFSLYGSKWISLQMLTIPIISGATAGPLNSHHGYYNRRYTTVGRDRWDGPHRFTSCKVHCGWTDYVCEDWSISFQHSVAGYWSQQPAGRTRTPSSSTAGSQHHSRLVETAMCMLIDPIANPPDAPKSTESRLTIQVVIHGWQGFVPCFPSWWSNINWCLDLNPYHPFLYHHPVDGP